MSTLIAGQNTSTNGNVDFNGGYVGLGNAFAGAVSGTVLDSATFNLYKTGTPTGSIYALLYACTGTPGSTGNVTGGVLATSDAITATTLLTTPGGDITFTFSGANRVALSTANYVIMCSHTTGDASNFITANFQALPSASYNEVYDTTGSGFGYVASQFPRFQVYSAPPLPPITTGISSTTGIGSITF